MKSSNVSPCIGVCQIHKDVCLGCHRTLNQIANWSKMSMEDRMKVMQEIESLHTTHDCPSCGSKTYCAMEAGKSANLCWCMYENAGDGIGYSDTCICKNCLRGTYEQN